ncbi:hypothetical protein SAMN05421858_2486 [Haladaptatus litoreus]|uniref:Uncharacterized protein n=1 Tax=Haladaptatus litoreus TaxID=553468 RepID=A0A1N7BD05_9EURY|nr:hypothetical protein SAMN05421858_2486 [Haladaptatus litoreus]
MLYCWAQVTTFVKVDFVRCRLQISTHSLPRQIRRVIAWVSTDFGRTSSHKKRQVDFGLGGQASGLPAPQSGVACA